MSKKAVLMMTFGSPEAISYEAVAEFFTNIRRGIRPEEDEIKTLYDNYVRIGGTPLQAITREEVRLVAEGLEGQANVYFANKFSRPFIPDVIAQMEADGIEDCLCLILEPHFSYYSVMGYEKFLESQTIRFQVIKDWYREPALINYWVEEIRKIIQEIGSQTYRVVFSAHSVPVFALEFGDPYIDQIYDNSRLIAEGLGLAPDQYTNTWQSESDIGMPWIKPDVLEYLREQSQHPDHYIFVPIAFISEHIEVLFDNDVECLELCHELGVGYKRPPMPNTDSRLIEALLSTVAKHLHGDYKIHQADETTFDEMAAPRDSDAILKEDQDIQMPDFVKKLIAKKGRENVKMPYLVKKMLEKKFGKKYD